MFQRPSRTPKKSTLVVIADSISTDSESESEEEKDVENWYKNRLNNYNNKLFWNNKKELFDTMIQQNFNKESLSSDDEWDISQDEVMSNDEINDMEKEKKIIETELKTKKQLIKEQKEKLKQERRERRKDSVRFEKFSKSKHNYYKIDRKNKESIVNIMKVDLLKYYDDMNKTIDEIKDSIVETNMTEFIRDSLLNVMIKTNYDGVFNDAIVYNNKILNYLGFYFTLKLINKDFNEKVKFNAQSILNLYKSIESNNDFKTCSAIYQSNTKSQETITNIINSIKYEIDNRKTSEYKKNITNSFVFDFIKCFAFFTTNWPYFNTQSITKLSLNKKYKMLIIKSKKGNKFSYKPLINEHCGVNKTKKTDQIISVGWKKDSLTKPNILGPSDLSNASVFIHINYNLLMRRSDYEILLNDVGKRLVKNCKSK